MYNLKFVRNRSLARMVEKGLGGRSSDSGVTVTVFGSSGWIGRNVMNKLGREGTQTVAPYRRADSHMVHYKVMADLGQFNLIEFWDIRDEEATRECVKRSDVVVNLIGRDYNTSNFSMQEVLVDFPVHLAKICKDEGVDRFIHVSACAASHQAEAESLRLKAFADARIREVDPRSVIIRPAKVYGWADYYFRMLAWSPGFAGLKFIGKNFNSDQPIIKMPVSIADVSQAIVNACRLPHLAGKTFDLLGPESYEMRELAMYIMRLVYNEPGSEEELENCLKEVPVSFIRNYAKIMCKLSWKFSPRWTPDRIDMIYATETDQGLPGLKELGISHPTTLEKGALDVVRPMRKWDYHHQPADETPLPKKYTPAQPDILAPL